MATNPALTQQASRRRDDPAVTGLVTQGQQRRSAGLGRAGRPVRPRCFGHLPQPPAGRRRRPGRRPRTSGSSSWISWIIFATRPRFPAGRPPPPGANAAASGTRPRPPRQLSGHSERKGSSEPCYAFLADPAIQGGGLAITVRTRRIPGSASPWRPSSSTTAAAPNGGYFSTGRELSRIRNVT